MNDNQIYWKVRVKEAHETDKGSIKKSTVEYLVEGPNPTYAEAKITEEYVGSTFDWEILAVTKTKIIKVIETVASV